VGRRLMLNTLVLHCTYTALIVHLYYPYTAYTPGILPAYSLVTSIHLALYSSSNILQNKKPGAPKDSRIIIKTTNENVFSTTVISFYPCYYVSCGR
jgi:hypothetical protein